MSADGSVSSLDAPVTVDGQGLPLWLLLELTYKCPLKCPWCNNPTDFDRYADELTTDEWVDVLRQARRLGSLQLGFSGGEPMLRRDLEALVGEATHLGYYTNLITSGMGLTASRLTALKNAGLKQIQLSLQACDAELNNRLVGVNAYAQKIAAARAIKAQGFPMVLNFPVSRHNIDQAEALLAFAEELGIEYVEFANLQYYNWALVNRAELLPTQEQLAKAESVVQEARARLGRRMTIYFVITDYYDTRPKACMKGWGNIHLTIGPDGAALPCQEARIIQGLEFPNVRDHDLAWIWHQSPVFRRFRGEEWMREPCRSCSERGHDYGGCRCQAFLLTGDAANTDPVCDKSPHHDLIKQAVAEAAATDRTPGRLIMRQRGLNRV
ncbi:MAG: pyrroloquinoline quinone biosynthesis protein PqqE [Rhodospirillales bacterium]|nr:pyrroloquinoline quinone biosynthesis protein PqqE [Rhodospirillales bacterium]